MRRLAFAAVAAILVFHAGSSHAGNTDEAACHHGLDTDRSRLATISDPTKKQQAYGHLKNAYTDLKANNFADCLTELKAAEDLAQ